MKDNESTAGNRDGSEAVPPYPATEEEFFRRKIASTRRDIALSVRDAERKFGQVLDPLVWVEKYPWRTTVFAALASWKLAEKIFDADVKTKAAGDSGETEPPVGLIKTLARILVGELAVPIVVNRVKRIAAEIRREFPEHPEAPGADAAENPPTASA